jgi:ferritin-like metal-binding protein YciE
MKLESLNALFLQELGDLYSAERQLARALPQMAKAATHRDLSNAFEDHLIETNMQVERLDSIFARLNQTAPHTTCRAMKGLVGASTALARKPGDPAVIDAGLIGAAQRIEHYEIAAYGCARTYAQLLGEGDIAETLSASLDAEKAADATLNRLAMSVINVKAAGVRT